MLVAITNREYLPITGHLTDSTRHVFATEGALPRFILLYDGQRHVSGSSYRISYTIYTPCHLEIHIFLC